MVAAALAMIGCGTSRPSKPELPSSISPGWSLKSFVEAPAPPAIAAAGSPVCWKASYAGEGTADVWVCGFEAEAGALDAVQRAQAEAQTVKFQEGRNFVLVRWNGAPKAGIEALVRAIQKAPGIAGKH
jgi:hypothetical protein